VRPFANVLHEVHARCAMTHNVMERRLVQYVRLGPQTVVIFVVMEKLRSLSGLGSF